MRYEKVLEMVRSFRFLICVYTGEEIKATASLKLKIDRLETLLKMKDIGSTSRRIDDQIEIIIVGFKTIGLCKEAYEVVRSAIKSESIFIESANEVIDYIFEKISEQRNTEITDPLMAIIQQDTVNGTLKKVNETLEKICYKIK